MPERLSAHDPSVCRLLLLPVQGPATSASPGRSPETPTDSRAPFWIGSIRIYILNKVTGDSCPLSSVRGAGSNDRLPRASTQRFPVSLQSRHSEDFSDTQADNGLCFEEKEGGRVPNRLPSSQSRGVTQGVF